MEPWCFWESVRGVGQEKIAMHFDYFFIQVELSKGLPLTKLNKIVIEREPMLNHLFECFSDS